MQQNNKIPMAALKAAATPSTQQPPINRLLRIKPIKERTGIPVSSLYYSISEGTFPPPIKLGERISAWVESEVDAVINARIRGESNEAIKELVTSLVAARQAMGVQS